MKSHLLVVVEETKPGVILSCSDLLAGADNRPHLEWPKIGQNTKAIALVFSILEWVSEWNEIAPSSSSQRDETRGDTFPFRSARRSRQ